MTLHKAHQDPRQVVVDEVAGLLQIDTLSEHVGGDDDVETPLAAAGARRWCAARDPHTADFLLAVPFVPDSEAIRPRYAARRSSRSVCCARWL
ncbi:MAG: hypothetical protein F4121_09095 [Acidimicrobiia bacterium]|nr:hypothetical protein [Acidimicrobiia bacterium]MYC44058.1 hypothetical protein [Acidimicrobiia bacterium]MYI20207.1 hypothetical protein [Acidimicrobiia bacterium]